MSAADRRTATLAAALVVSDATSLAVLGLNARQYRALLRERGIRHVKVGRRTLARAADVLSALGLGDVEAPTSRPAWNEDEAIRTYAARPRRTR